MKHLYIIIVCLCTFSSLFVNEGKADDPLGGIYRGVEIVMKNGDVHKGYVYHSSFDNSYYDDFPRQVMMYVRTVLVPEFRAVTIPSGNGRYYKNTFYISSKNNHIIIEGQQVSTVRTVPMSYDGEIKGHQVLSYPPEEVESLLNNKIYSAAIVKGYSGSHLFASMDSKVSKNEIKEGWKDKFQLTYYGKTDEFRNWEKARLEQLRSMGVLVIKLPGS